MFRIQEDVRHAELLCLNNRIGESIEKEIVWNCGRDGGVFSGRSV